MRRPGSGWQLSYWAKPRQLTCREDSAPWAAKAWFSSGRLYKINLRNRAKQAQLTERANVRAGHSTCDSERERQNRHRGPGASARRVAYRPDFHWGNLED